MTKPVLDERFADWVDGRLKPADRVELEAQLARDPALARAADEYRRTVQLMRGALAPPVLPSVADAVIARLEPQAAPRPRTTIRPLFASMIAAAALILAFVILRAIPPSTTSPNEVDVTRSAKADAPVRQEFFALDGVRPGDAPTPSAEATDLSGVEKKAETEHAAPRAAESKTATPRPKLDPRAGVQADEEGSERERLARELRSQMEQAEEGAGAANANPRLLRVAASEGLRRGNAAAGAESKDVAAPSRAEPSAAAAGDDKDLVQWAEGLGELALVVEPGTTDARASDPLVLLDTVARVGSARAGETAVRDEARLALVVREDLGVDAGDKGKELAGDTRAVRARRAVTGRAATASGERVFVVSGTVDAVRRFARDLRLEVAAHDGRVLVERSSALGKSGTDAEGSDDFFLGGARRERADSGVLAGSGGGAGPGAGRGAAASPGPTSPGPTSPGATGPATAGPAQPVRPDKQAPTPPAATSRVRDETGAPTSDRVELRVIVRVRPR